MEVIQPADVAVPQAPYSTVLVHGDLVFLSGQVPIDKEGRLVADDFETQAQQVFHNLRACLNAAGADFSDVLKVSAYLADFADFASYNEIYTSYFAPPYPVRTTVQAGLYGFKIELDVIARRQ
jgi:2-iminobutanoate/2-iminopropanoate deaminase